MNNYVRGNLGISILKKRDIFRWRVVKFCENFVRKRKLGLSLLCQAYNYDIDDYVCNVKS